METRVRKYWVMDAETIRNCSIFVFTDYLSDESHSFSMWGKINQFPEMIEFLRQNVRFKDYHFGFNNMNFDAQIIEMIINRHEEMLEMDADGISDIIYKYAQYVINKSRNKEFLDYPEWKLSIRILDVYKVNHWDNANKRCSLKWLQYSMDWENVEEMPHEHFEPVLDKATFDMVLSYCINDVDSTKKVIQLSKDAIALRTSLNRSYDIPCTNWSNTKIGSELLMKLYCEKTGKHKRMVKDSRTHREFIELKKIIFPYVQFKEDIFEEFLEKVNNITVYNTKGDFSEVVTFMGYHFHYGLGGIHQCIEKGMFVETEDRMIIDADVASLYPSIAVVNNMYPEHLGPEFYDVYKNDLVDVRLAEKKKPKEEKDMSIIDGFKEAANASYGNSNSQYSWLFDSQYTMETTVNGQLMLTMIIEEMLTSIKDSVLLQTNTDGWTMIINRDQQEQYYEICKRWEKKTNLILEYAEYSKMLIWDVNNYIAVDKGGYVKSKGRFAWEDFDKYKASVLHKNKSHLIVAKAIYAYFIDGIMPEDYLKSNRNIYDYCAGKKLRGDWFFEELKVTKGVLSRTKHKKILRYYVSKHGSKIVKGHPDGRTIQLEAGAHLQTIMNKYVKKTWEEYDVDDKYYLDKIYSEIQAIDDATVSSKQLSFF